MWAGTVGTPRLPRNKAVILKSKLAYQGKIFSVFTEQVRAVDGLQIGGEAGQLKLAGLARMARVGEIEREERIDGVESDHEPALAEEARGAHPLAGGQAGADRTHRRLGVTPPPRSR